MHLPPAVLTALLLVAVALGGCADDPAAPDEPAPMPAAPPVHILEGTVELAGLEPPTFTLRAPVAAGGPLYGAGEPGIVAALDGTLYVTFPGCDDGPYYFVSYPDSETCGHGLIWKSTDLGETWTRLNRHPDGLLTEDGPEANGDADVAVDSAGTVYASNLGGGGIQFHRSLDGGATWAHMANIVPPTEDPEDDPDVHEGADRQWFAAAGPGHVINNWMRTSPERDVEVNTTFDGGVTWVGNATFGDGIGWVGSVQFAPDGLHAYIPYTQPQGTGTAIPIVNGGDTFSMHVIRTADGGRTWEDIDTGMSWQTTLTGLHWSGGHMAPALDVTGDGTVVVTMAVDRATGVGGPVTNEGSELLVSYSRDDGATWSPTERLLGSAVPGAAAAPASTRIFPWVAGGAGDRFAITYYAAPTPFDNDAAGTVWSLQVLVFDGAAEGALRAVQATIDPAVHEGPICTRGGLCAGPVDRTLLDYFENDVTADGRLVVVYPADSATTGKDIEIRVAVQDGGSLLFERLEPAAASGSAASAAQP